MLQAPSFDLQNGILYFIDSNHNHQKRAIVPHQLQQQLLGQTHRGPSPDSLITGVGTVCTRILWSSARSTHSVLQWVVLVAITSHHCILLLSVDLLRFLGWTLWNYLKCRVETHMFTKWPIVFPVPVQRPIRIVNLLSEHIVPFCGVPEALLSDHGANLSHLMLDMCKSLGIHKLN